ncbi:MAG: glycosyltransferase [Gemmataceae bacterium]|nr:glycosyltransferase [Gemmataceae bacterium]
MTTGTPAVSVLMPVYNAGPYLAEAVESVLGQTFGDLELVAIDDGSTDGSGAVLDRFAAADPRVRVVHQPNGGLVAALTHGYSLCRAPLVARMDADDVSLPGRLAAQVAHLEAHPDCVLVGTQIVLIDPDGRELRRTAFPTDHPAADRHQLFGWGSVIAHPTAVYRRSAYDAAGGYTADTYPAEDFDLWLRMAEVGRMAVLPDHLLRYRVHPKSISSQNRAVGERVKWRAIRRALARRGLGPRDVPFAELPHDLRYNWVDLALEAGWYWTARRWAVRRVARRPDAEGVKQLGRAALGPLLRYALPAYDRLLGRGAVRAAGGTP